MLMKSIDQMRAEITYYLRQNGIDTLLDGFDDDSISFFYSCLRHLSNPKENSTLHHNDWREESSKYGREFLEGSLSITPPTPSELLDSIIKWGKYLQDMVPNDDPNMCNAKFIFNVFLEIPKFLKHIKIIRTKAEQCVFYQISILGQNKPNNWVSFDELKDFGFGILDSSFCPYAHDEDDEHKCLFWEDRCIKNQCSNCFDDKLVKVLQQLKEKGVIKIDFTNNSISVV